MLQYRGSLNHKKNVLAQNQGRTQNRMEDGNYKRRNRVFITLPILSIKWSTSIAFSFCKEVKQFKVLSNIPVLNAVELFWNQWTTIVWKTSYQTRSFPQDNILKYFIKNSVAPCVFNLFIVSLVLVYFNRDVDRGCLVYIFSLRFSGSKFLINLRRQFRVRRTFSCM